MVAAHEDEPAPLVHLRHFDHGEARLAVAKVAAARPAAADEKGGEAREKSDREKSEKDLRQKSGGAEKLFKHAAHPMSSRRDAGPVLRYGTINGLSRILNVCLRVLHGQSVADFQGVALRR